MPDRCQNCGIWTYTLLHTPLRARSMRLLLGSAHLERMHAGEISPHKVTNPKERPAGKLASRVNAVARSQARARSVTGRVLEKTKENEKSHLRCDHRRGTRVHHIRVRAPVWQSLGTIRS